MSRISFKDFRRPFFARSLAVTLVLGWMSAFAQQPDQGSSGPATPAADTASSATPDNATADLDGILGQGGDTKPAPDASSNPADPAPSSAEATPQTAPEKAAAEILPTIPLAKAPAKPIPAGHKAPQAGIEEIVVTATKREQSLREIPASISALSGESLEKSGAQGIEDIVKRVPGVNITNDGVNAAQITIRGIASIAGTNPTTGLLFGDVSFTDFYVPRVTLDPNPFDLKSVEVLKGPQGTLFGAGALNGAVRYVPEPPKFDEWEVKYFGQYQSISGGAAAPTFGAAINAPIGDSQKLALRVMAFDRTTPGYIDDIGTNTKNANELDQKGLRGILGWRPTDAWNVALTYAMQETHLRDSQQTDNPDGRMSRSNTPKPSTTDNIYHLADLRAAYEGDWAQFVSESAYVTKRSNADLDLTHTFMGLVPASRLEQGESTTVSQELRMQSLDGSGSDWQWVTGVTALRQHFLFSLNAPIGPTVEPLSTLLAALEPLAPGISTINAGGGRVNLLSIAADARVQEVALFGDTTWRFSPGWELSVGGRYYRTSSGGPVTQGGALLIPTNLALTSTNRNVVHEKGLNPKVSLSWHMTDDLMAYTTVSRGFRVGGTQVGATTILTQAKAPAVFKSDTIWNYEAGLRTTWLDNTLHFDITGFHSVWKDPQAILPDASGLIVYYDNVGGVKSNGIEAAFEYQLPFGGLTLSTSGAFTKTYTTAAYVAPDGTNLPPGQKWPLSPRWQTATTLAHASEWGDWTLGCSVTHTFLGQAINNLARRQAVFGYRLWDAQINVANPAQRWLPEIAVVMNNALNSRGLTNIDGSVGDVSYVYVQPRSLIIRLSGKF